MASLYLGTGPLEQELVRLRADGAAAGAEPASLSQLTPVPFWPPDVGVLVVCEQGRRC